MPGRRVSDEAARMTRLHYEHGLTHQQIAEMFGVTRVKVTRLLAQARDAGLVRIKVDSDVRLFEREAELLRRKFGLEQVWLAPTGATREETARSIAQVGAHALPTVLRPGSTVAIALSNTIAATIARMDHLDLGCVAAPATGSLLGSATAASPMEVAMQLARTCHGRAHRLPAPLLAHDTAAAARYRKDPGISLALGLAADAEILLAGIGSVEHDGGLLTSQFTDQECAELLAAGAVGDLAASFFDSHGNPVETDITRRSVGISLNQARAIPHRIGFGYGETRRNAILVAIARQLVTMLVTDLDTARHLIESDFPIG